MKQHITKGFSSIKDQITSHQKSTNFATQGWMFS